MARVLIAEDDPQASEMIRRLCEFKGHEVTEARDTAQALEALGAGMPDLLITDLAMPAGGGQRLVREMRAQEGGTAVPVIVVTGYAGLLSDEEREELSPCQILDKPLDLEETLAAVDLALKVVG